MLRFLSITIHSRPLHRNESVEMKPMMGLVTSAGSIAPLDQIKSLLV